MQWTAGRGVVSSWGMTGEQLQALMLGVFGRDLMLRLAREYKLVQRERSLDVVRLVLALVLTGGPKNAVASTPS